MADIDKKDVLDDSSTSVDTDKDKSKPDGGDNDKDKNFAELRKSLAEKDAEIERLKNLVPPEKDDDEDKPEPTDAERVAFNRDLKEVTIRLTGKLKLTPEQIKAIQDEVTFTGNEVQSEIEAKITKAYNSLPEVQSAREKALVDKGRREVMNQFSDDEMDIGGGGDADLGNDGTHVRLSPKESRFAKNVAGGLTKEELASIDRSADPNQWKVGPMPTRKAFKG